MSCDIGMALNGVLISSTFCFVKKNHLCLHMLLSPIFNSLIMFYLLCVSLQVLFAHFFCLFFHCTCLILAHRKYLIHFFCKFLLHFFPLIFKKIDFFYVSFLELFQNFILVFCHVAFEDCLPLSKFFQMFLPIVICCATPSFFDFAFVLLHNIELCMPLTFFLLLSKISLLPFFLFLKCCKHKNFVV